MIRFALLAGALLFAAPTFAADKRPIDVDKMTVTLTERDFKTLFDEQAALGYAEGKTSALSERAFAKRTPDAEKITLSYGELDDLISGSVEGALAVEREREIFRKIERQRDAWFRSSPPSNRSMPQ